MRPAWSEQPAELLFGSVHEKLLPGFLGAGFECTHFIRRSGGGVDELKATRHDQFALLDYLRLQKHGFRFAREGVPWHRVETVPGRYDFSAVLPIARSARSTGTTVIWDLCHFGWPDHLDLFSSSFISSLARYGAAFAEWLANEVNTVGLFVPVNEISFFSWASGEEGTIYPFATGRGYELKKHLVRAAIETMEAIWEVLPTARFVHADPAIHVLPHPRHPEDAGAAEAYRLSQFQGWDMLSGTECPELGGQDKYLDLLGINYYPQNQWFYHLRGCRRVRQFKCISPRHPQYRPFREIINEIHTRYQRPLLITETGAEDRRRASWLRYVCNEVKAAIGSGIDVQGICLYPILNHPGWVDDRHCCNGLWDYADAHGNRPIYQPLAAEIEEWRRVFKKIEAHAIERREVGHGPARGFRPGGNKNGSSQPY